jgi:hypothetical protein
MGEMKKAYIILVRKCEGKRNLDDLGVYGKIILQWILGKEDGKAWTGCIWLRLGASEHGNEPSGSIKGREFLD